MTLILDDREDSYIQKALATYDLPVATSRLDFGDAMWEGCGPAGACLVGVERKRLPDLIASMKDRRLAGWQIRGMSKAYDYICLIVEGVWRPTPSGAIEVHEHGSWRPLYHQRQGISYRQVTSYISSLTYRAGLFVWRTSSAAETAAWYVSEYMSWQKPWGDHHAHETIYADGPSKHRKGQQRGRAMIATRDPGLVEQVAAQFPHLDRRAWLAGGKFRTVREMVTPRPLTKAEMEEMYRRWREALKITGGKKIVGDVMEAIHDGKPQDKRP
jgi:hypothetical protein